MLEGKGMVSGVLACRNRREGKELQARMSLELGGERGYWREMQRKR
jgi:hypothetical protein